MKSQDFLFPLGLIFCIAVSNPVLADGKSAMVSNFCAKADINAGNDAFVKMIIEPGAVFVPPVSNTPSAQLQNPYQDWANICRYKAANDAQKIRPDIIFMGDSLTDFWQYGDPSFFNQKRLNRGISGQVSAQMLLRFQADVIAHKPRVVHILAGGNDLASNAGLTTEQVFKDNMIAMTTLAKANGVKVIIGSLPPITKAWWAADLQPIDEIKRLNIWLKAFAKANGYGFVDYYNPLMGKDGSIAKEYSNDGVHPNRNGYKVMEKAAKPIIEKILKSGR